QGYFDYVMELADDAGQKPDVTSQEPQSCRTPPLSNPTGEGPGEGESKAELGKPTPELDQSLVTSAATISPETYVPKTLGQEIANRGRMPVEECLWLGMSLTGALARLHKHGLVHRDIKPSNIVFVNGALKLADV